MTALRFWWWTLSGSMLWLALPCVYLHGASATARLACEWVGYCPPLVYDLLVVDRNCLGVWLVAAVALGCSYVAWQEEYMREVLLGVWVLTAFLTLLTYGVVQVP